MKLVSMKREGGDNDCWDCGPSANYGYGLQLYLDADQCEKLGINKALAAGTKVTIQAMAIISSATDSVARDDGRDISLSIQITDLGLKEEGKASNAAAILYGNG
jgi:hypothetical protein